MDRSFYKDIASFAAHTSWLHGFMEGFAKYGIAVFGLLLVVGYLVARVAPDAPRRVARDVWAAAAALIAVGIGQPINSAVQRPRPFVALHMHPLVAHAADYGFPSDHATAAGAVAAGLWLVRRWLGAVTTFFALLMAFARVYVGVHYPGDVAGGLLLGAVVALLLGLLALQLLVPLARRLARTPLRPLLAARTVRL